MKWYYGLYPTDRIKIKNKYKYLSDFFPDINIMFSIWPLIYRCNHYLSKIKNDSFRHVFSIPNETEVIADSGAFGYHRLKNKCKLDWNLKIILKLYRYIKPNYAVHNDIPVNFLIKNRTRFIQKLLKKNIRNALEFIKCTKDEIFTPIGVAQGVMYEDYIRQIEELYSIGYKYIGIGGIAYLGLKRINLILSNIFRNDDIKRLKLKIHIFGVGKYDILKKYPIHSFDNTTPLNDSHRDKSGKRTYYYIINNMKNSFSKRSIFELQKINYKVQCKCPVCQILSEEIIYTGSALRNHSRAFHNAYTYNKMI